VHVVSLSCNPVPPVRYGGIELMVAHQCEGIQKIGGSVVCYSPGELSIANVKHARTLPTHSPNIGAGGVPNTIAHLAAVKAELQERVGWGDVVVLNHPDHYGYLRHRIAFNVHLKAVFCEVAHWTHVGMKRNVIYPSAGSMRAIGRPGAFIPHGVKLLFGHVQPRKEDFLLFAGRITRDKGVDIALAACAAMNVKLLLAGPLNDQQFASGVIGHPLVEYLGELTYQELLPYYERAKALVYMTQYVEPFGLSIVEAMAAGCPVITTGMGGTGETVLAGKTGYFCRTAEDIVAAYARLDRIRPADCIERASEYSVQRMARSYVRYFQGLTG
jgi:glycosyltransferase involved in cell wall biosynthesis